MSKPRLIIRTLEDSPKWLDQRLVTAYLTTHYWVAWPDEKGFFLTIGDTNQDLRAFLENLGIQAFAIITAANPHSTILEPAENGWRNKMLELELRSATTLLFPSQNISHDDTWMPEAGFCACGIPEEMAFDLGNKYDQNAIVWWEKGKAVELWWLNGK